ncbi:MAG TPA: hypothetical protein DF712_06135, partial [Balneola sp.]|nr:hypothetical protein [Balneola sp.]
TTLEEIISNEVNVVVDATINFSLELENSIKRFRGDKVEFDHFLVNNGNVASTFDIKIYNWDQGEYDLENLEWISGNKSRTQFSDTLRREITLNPGERFDFRYSGSINEAEDDSITSIVNVEAVSREFGIRLLKRDSVYVLSGARIELNKSQSGSEEKLPNENFTYTIAGVNSGDVPALPRAGITIDGIS